MDSVTEEGAMAEQFRAQKEIIGQSTIQASKEIWSRLCNSWGETQRGWAAATWGITSSIWAKITHQRPPLGRRGAPRSV